VGDAASFTLDVSLTLDVARTCLDVARTCHAHALMSHAHALYPLDARTCLDVALDVTPT